MNTRLLTKLLEDRYPEALPYVVWEKTDYPFPLLNCTIMPEPLQSKVIEWHRKLMEDYDKRN